MLALPLLVLFAAGSSPASLERFPFDPEAGAVYLRLFEQVQADPAGAVPHLEQLVVRAPANPRGWRLLGFGQLRVGNVTRAEQALERALELGIDGPRRADTLTTLAGIFLDRRNAEAAKRLVDEARHLAPDHPMVMVEHARLLAVTGRIEEAKAAADRLTALHPDVAQGHALAGYIKATSGDMEGAAVHVAAARAHGLEAEWFEKVETEAASARWARLLWQVPLGLASLLLFGLLLLWAAGGALSETQLGQLSAQTAHLLRAEQTPEERRVDRLYNAVLWFGSGLYFASVPGMLILTAACGGAVLTAVLMLPYIPVKLLLVLGAVVLGALLSIITGLFASAPEGEPLRELRPEEAPGLFAALGEVAEVAKARPVDKVFLELGPGIGVCETGGSFQVLRGRGVRELHLGLAAARALTVPELKVILAHEYGHFSHGETRITPLLARVQRSAAVTLGALQSQGGVTFFNPVYWFLRLYFAAYLRATMGHGRRRELLADRMAALAYGGDTFARALQRAVEAAEAWSKSLPVALSARALGTRGDRLFTLVDEAEAARPEAHRSWARKALLERVQDEFDSHPPPAERMARVSGVPAHRVEAPGPATELFADFAALEEELSGALLAEVDGSTEPPPHPGASRPPMEALPLARAIALQRSAMELCRASEPAGLELLEQAFDAVSDASHRHPEIVSEVARDSAGVLLEYHRPAPAHALLTRALQMLEQAADAPAQDVDALREMLSVIPPATSDAAPAVP